MEREARNLCFVMQFSMKRLSLSGVLSLFLFRFCVCPMNLLWS